MEIKPINFKDIHDNDKVVIYEHNSDDIVPAIHDIKIKSIDIIESYADDCDEDVIRINDTNKNSYFLTNNVDFLFNDLEDAYTYILSKLWKDLNHIQKCSILHELLSEELWIYNIDAVDNKDGCVSVGYEYDYTNNVFKLCDNKNNKYRVSMIGKSYKLVI